MGRQKKKKANKSTLMILMKKKIRNRQEGKRKQTITGCFGYHLSERRRGIKGENKLQGRKEKVMQAQEQHHHSAHPRTPRPPFNNVVKITVRSVSFLRSAGENVGLCGRCCTLTLLRTIKKETICHSSSS